MNCYIIEGHQRPLMKYLGGLKGGRPFHWEEVFGLPLDPSLTNETVPAEKINSRRTKPQPYFKCGQIAKPGLNVL